MVKKIQNYFEVEVGGFRANKYEITFNLLQSSIPKTYSSFEDNMIMECDNMFIMFPLPEIFAHFKCHIYEEGK